MYNLSTIHIYHVYGKHHAKLTVNTPHSRLFL